jgi:hypothetical protein
VVVEIFCPQILFFWCVLGWAARLDGPLAWYLRYQLINLDASASILIAARTELSTSLHSWRLEPYQLEPGFRWILADLPVARVRLTTHPPFPQSTLTAPCAVSADVWHVRQLGWCGHIESWRISLDAIDVHIIVGVLDL